MINGIYFNDKPTNNSQLSHNEMEKKLLLKLQEEYKQKPFKYAKVDYFDNSQTKITIYRENNIFPKLKTILKKNI